MLFTYKNCGCCKKEMTNTKVLLNNIFPAGICDEICDYNLHCEKCKDLNEKECRYINFNYHFDYFKDKELTRVEKQMCPINSGHLLVRYLAPSFLRAQPFLLFIFPPD